MTLAEKRIVLLTDSGAIPSLYVRFVDPIQYVTTNYNIVASHCPGAEIIARDADLLILHRWFGNWTCSIVDAARRRGVPIVYEADDNLLDLAPDTGLMLGDQHRANIEDALRKADLVIASTRPLADAFGEYNWNVTVLENYGLGKPDADVMGPPHLAVVNTDYFKLRDTKQPFFEALDLAVRELGYRITFFGTADPAALKLQERHGDNIAIIEGFLDDRSAFLDRLLEHGVNVGIVPLEDSRQHSYKSDIKFLDFASIGVPGIYNNRAVYGVVRHCVDGFLSADSREGWYAGLAYFADAEHRRTLGAAAREVVRAGRSIEHYADRLAETFATLLACERGEGGDDGRGGRIMSADERIGLFWEGEQLYLLHREKRRHIVRIDIVPALLDAGIGFVEPGADLRRRLIAGPPLTSESQLPEVLARSPQAAITAANGRPLRIAWVVPGLIIGGGGHRNIIRCAYHLERLGHEVAIYLIDTPESGPRNAQLVREHFYPLRGHIGLFHCEIDEVDFIFATHWSTVKYVDQVSARCREIVYFVQDFEPSFYAMGSEYVMAEATYRRGYYAITSGIWCEEFLRSRFGCEADHFQFPIDRKIYYSEEMARRNRVIFFAKPEMPRRCYELGVAALRLFHQQRPDIEIAFYGSAALSGTLPGFPVTQLGVLPGPADLAQLYRTSLLGIVFSTTNPSLVPYEMMACGLPVVDLDRPGNELNYDSSYDIARLADPEPSVLAQALSQMVADTNELATRSARGVDFTGGFPSEEDVGRRIESLLLKRAEQWDIV